MKTFVDDFKSNHINGNLALEKWKSLLCNILFTKNDIIVKEVAIFCEYYGNLLEDLSKLNLYQTTTYVHKLYDLFPLEKCIKILSDEINKELIHGVKRIEYEYHNILTDQKGIMLEGNIMFENGKYVNVDINKLVEEKVIKKLKDKMYWILSPSLRTREKKLKRILNEK